MGHIRDYTDPYLATLRAVPPAAPGVCACCHWAADPGHQVCWSCATTRWQVSAPVETLIPVTLYERSGPTHTLLRGYKRDWPDHRQLQRLSTRVAALLARFLVTHRHHVGEWDVVTCVPSSQGRPGPHPLERIVGMVGGLARQHEPLLEAGPRSLDRLRADDHGYRASSSVAGRNVLLVDDTFVTGTRLQSAASALRLGGAASVVALVIGRYVRPEYSNATARLWKAVRARPYDFDRCCGCEPPWPAA